MLQCDTSLRGSEERRKGEGWKRRVERGGDSRRGESEREESGEKGGKRGEWRGGKRGVGTGKSEGRRGVEGREERGE